MYAYSSDGVDRTAKAFLEHLESNLSEEDYTEAAIFIEELTGYVKESAEDTADIEKKIANLAK